MMTTGNRRWWALGATMLSVLAIGLDATVLSVALPTLANWYHASESDLQWFSSGYLLVLTAAMLPAGLLGDRFGRRKVLIASLSLFGIGSIACALAPTAVMFIAARFLLGAAGAGIVVMALSSLTVLFSKEERPRAVGIWAAVNFLALPIGPILGGWLLSNYWWGWVFLINIPVALLGLAAVATLVPESRSTQAPGLDAAGIVSSSAGLVALTYGMIGAGQFGWSDPRVALPIAAGLVLLVFFFLWEARLTRQPNGSPLVDLNLFRSAWFTWGIALSAIGSLAMFGVIFAMPQYFQAIAGTNAMGSGLRLLPLIGGLVLGAVPADRVSRLVGPKLTTAAGFIVLATGLYLGSRMAVASSLGFVGLWMALVGAGMGIALSTAASAALSELSPERSGVGSAVMQAFQKIGGPFGSAILGSVVAATYRGQVDLAGLPGPLTDSVRASVFGGLAVAHRTHSTVLLDSVRSSFVNGLDSALMVSAGIAVAGLVLTLVFLPSGRRPAPAMTAIGDREPVPLAG